MQMWEGLERGVGLRELNLSACNIQGHLRQFALVLQTMGACPNLQVLDLSSTPSLTREWRHWRRVYNAAGNFG